MGESDSKPKKASIDSYLGRYLLTTEPSGLESCFVWHDIYEVPAGRAICNILKNIVSIEANSATSLEAWR